MGSIHTFLRAGTVFEPSELAAMGRAYDTVYATLQLNRAPASLRESIAAEIIAVAWRANADPTDLAAVVLQHIATGRYSNARRTEPAPSRRSAHVA